MTRGQTRSLGFLPHPPNEQCSGSTPTRAGSCSTTLPQTSNGLTVSADTSHSRKRIRFPMTDMSSNIMCEVHPLPATPHPIAPPIWSLSSRRHQAFGALTCTDTGGHDVELAHPSKPHGVIGSTTGKVWVYTRFPDTEEALYPSRPILQLPRQCSCSRHNSRRRPSSLYSDAKCRLPRGDCIERAHLDEGGGPLYHYPLDQVFIRHKVLLFDPTDTTTSPSAAAVSSPSTAVSSSSPIRRNPFMNRLALSNERQIRRRWPAMNRVRANSATRSVAGSEVTPATGGLFAGTLQTRRYQYVGGIRDGRRHGWGRLTDDQHTILEGTWRHGRLEGWFIAYHEYYVEMGFRSPFYRIGVIVLGDLKATIIPFATQLPVDDNRGVEFHISEPPSTVAFFAQSRGSSTGRRRNSPFLENLPLLYMNSRRRRSADCESPRRAKISGLDLLNRSCPIVPFEERPPRPWQKRETDHDAAEQQRRRSESYRSVCENPSVDVGDNSSLPAYTARSHEPSLFEESRSERDRDRIASGTRYLLPSARSEETGPWSRAETDSEAGIRQLPEYREDISFLTTKTLNKIAKNEVSKDLRFLQDDIITPSHGVNDLSPYNCRELTSSDGVGEAQYLRNDADLIYPEKSDAKGSPADEPSVSILPLEKDRMAAAANMKLSVSDGRSRHDSKASSKANLPFPDRFSNRKQSPNLREREGSISLSDWSAGGWPVGRFLGRDRHVGPLDDHYSSPASETSRLAALSSLPSAMVGSESRGEASNFSPCCSRLRRANSSPGADYDAQLHPPFDTLESLLMRQTAEAPAACCDRPNPNIRFELLSTEQPLRGMDLTRWDVSHVCRFLMCIGAFSAVPIFRTERLSGDRISRLSPQDLMSMGMNDYMCAKFVLTALRYLWGLLDWNEPLLKPLWLAHHPVAIAVPQIAREHCEYRRKIGCGGHASVWKGYLVNIAAPGSDTSQTTVEKPSASQQLVTIPVAFKIFISSRRRQNRLHLQTYLNRVSSTKSRRLSPSSALLLRIPSPASFLPRFGFSTTSDSGRSGDAASNYGQGGVSTVYSKPVEPPTQPVEPAVESRDALSSASANMTSFVKNFRWWIKRTLSPRSVDEATSTQLPSITIATASSTAAAPSSTSVAAIPDTNIVSPSTSTCVSSSIRLTSPNLGAENDNDLISAMNIKKSSSLKIRNYELSVMQSLPYHPNVLRVIGYGEISTSLPMLVLEFCSGGALADHIVPEGKSPANALRSRYEWPEIVRIFANVAEGLNHLHVNGYYHRDLKPSNFLIGPDGTSKIADMGVSKSYRVGQPSAFFLTAYGNAYYAAPEVLRGEGFWPQSDVYSFGISFWEALTGKLVHEGYSRAEVISRVATNRISVPAPAHLSPDIKALLEDMIQYDWRDRPTFAEVAARFREIEKKNQEALLSSVQHFMGL